MDDGYDDQAEKLLNGHKPSGNLRGGKYSAFEGGTRVPVIVRWPKIIRQPEVSDALISQIDWAASLASLVGACLPKGSVPDSQNRMNTLLGKDKTDRPWVIEQASNHALSVRTKNWKYIEPSSGVPFMYWGPKIETGYLETPQLYNMEQAGEKENLATQHPEKVFELEQILREVRKENR